MRNDSGVVVSDIGDDDSDEDDDEDAMSDGKTMRKPSLLPPSMLITQISYTHLTPRLVQAVTAAPFQEPPC